jgi:hypothetical protein
MEINGRDSPPLGRPAPWAVRTTGQVGDRLTAILKMGRCHERTL